MEASLNRNALQSKTERYPVLGMSCAACALSVEKHLSRQKGVAKVAVNFADKSLQITYQTDKIQSKDLQKSLRDIGFDLGISSNNSPQASQAGNHELKHLFNRMLWAILLALPVFLLGMGWLDLGWYSHPISFFLTTLILFGPGKSFFVNAYKKLRFRQWTMDSLVALSTATAFLFSSLNTFYPLFLASYGIRPFVYFES
ncbi:MAG: cation transporter, partial [Bacteroidota bacterium]